MYAPRGAVHYLDGPIALGLESGHRRTRPIGRAVTTSYRLVSIYVNVNLSTKYSTGRVLSSILKRNELAIECFEGIDISHRESIRQMTGKDGGLEA